MYEYRQVLLRMRQGATDRAIARSKLMGRKKARQVREMAEGRGWLDAAVALPDDAALAAVFSRRPAASSVSPLTAYREAIERWLDQNIQQTTILSLLRRTYGYTGSYSSVRRYVARLRPPSTRATIDKDVERLLQACDKSSAKGRRDHAILLLLARLGLRASEVLALELEDLHWRTGEIIVRGKGLVSDRLPLVPDVGEALALYLQKDRPACGSRRVFLCTRAPHRGFSHPSSISTIVARTLALAGLAPAARGAHLLRHSLATRMLRRGASLAEIGQVLRHRSANTTEIYAKLDFDALRDVAMPWPTARGAR